MQRLGRKCLEHSFSNQPNWACNRRVFHEHDERIKSTQLGGYLDPSCIESPFIPNGVLIEFGTPWPRPRGGHSWGTAIFIDVLQLSNDPRVIDGPNPGGFGLQLFGHEVVHWAQGWIRFTIQGELLARYVEQQLRNDLKNKYGEIREGDATRELVESFNPFYVQHLREARVWMINNFDISYAFFPLPSIGGLDKSWLDRFYVNIPLPDPALDPMPIPAPPPPLPPIETPTPPSQP